MTSLQAPSAFPARSEASSPSWPPPPRIVAEALVSLAEAPLPLSALPAQPAALVARSMARAALPAESTLDAPAWLLPEQRAAFRRALAAVEMFGGALVAEPTGTGKTFIALAVAAASSCRPPVCLVPAAVLDQWERAADQVRVPVLLGTHERASRGSLPRPSGFVVIDESHRLRNRVTRRYRAVARWLVGQRALLLSATPVVNRLDDVIAQLALVLRDDALAPWGVESLASVAEAASLPDSLARVVIRSSRPAVLPASHYRREQSLEDSTCIQWIDELRLSRSTTVAGLARGVFLRAAASSMAALAAAFRRYRLLLLHAADAAASGAQPSRSALRAWIGEAAEQTALWPLLADHMEDTELALADLPAIEAIEAKARALRGTPDERSIRLIEMLGDGRRTVVFTAWRETASWLLDRLGTTGIAWCTGSEAGIGRYRMPRAHVLGCFRPGAPESAPRILIATDVASEGLDLQGAERVVHYDLPWTPMRLAQRDGRARRLGNPRPAVEIVRFDPSGDLDRRIRQTEILRNKGKLPARAGLSGDALGRWRMLLEDIAPGEGVRGAGLVAWAGPPGVLVAIELRSSRWRPAAAEIAWLGFDGTERREPAWLARALEAALEPSAERGASRKEIEAGVARAEAYIREALRRSAATRWNRNARGTEPRRLVRALALLARSAARERDAPLLERIDDALRFTARGHTAGEALLVEELAHIERRALVDRLSDVPSSPHSAATDAVLAGAVVFRSNPSSLR